MVNILLYTEFKYSAKINTWWLQQQVCSESREGDRDADGRGEEHLLSIEASMNEENSEEDSDQTGDRDANGRPKCGRIGLETLVDRHVVGFAEKYIG